MVMLETIGISHHLIPCITESAEMSTVNISRFEIKLEGGTLHGKVLKVSQKAGFMRNTVPVSTLIPLLVKRSELS